jgi:hypothetical protein
LSEGGGNKEERLRKERGYLFDSMGFFFFFFCPFFLLPPPLQSTHAYNTP